MALEDLACSTNETSQGELKQGESFSLVVSTIIENNLGIELKQQLLQCKLEDLKLAYQHCGGSMKELPDHKKDSVAGALALREMLLVTLNTKNDFSDDTDNTNDASVETDNVNVNKDTTNVHGECVEKIDV